MPRKGRGGSREGAAQTAYANRTDLNQRGPEPITTAPGQAYGEAAAQREAQPAVPMAGIQTPAPQPQMTQTPAAPNPEPGTLSYLHPTERPDEPVTSGIPIGAGPGPSPASVVPNNRLSDLFGSAASSPYATPEIVALAQYARMLET